MVSGSSACYSSSFLLLLIPALILFVVFAVLVAFTDLSASVQHVFIEANIEYFYANGTIIPAGIESNDSGKLITWVKTVSIPAPSSYSA